VSGTAAPVVRKNAPRPVDMVHLFDSIEQASDLFVNQRYAEVIPLLQRIRTEDPFNLDATLRLAVAQSALGRDALAVQMFDKAAELAPESADVRLYRALHFAKGAEWPRAVATLERIVADTPDRQPAVDALASIRARQGLQAMAQGRTPEAIASLEDSRRLRPSAFRNDLELGVLYLAGRRFVEARDALDRFLTAQPTHPMGLFKRAQVSALLREPDTRRRIDLAKQHADATTRPLIASERLFR
jgi:tetratricopeptide (TPR) repeat protein